MVQSRLNHRAKTFSRLVWGEDGCGVYLPRQFADWLSGFLPDFGGLKPVASPDRSDGKLAHLDGLN
jgi:hypothetical protein